MTTTLVEDQFDTKQPNSHNCFVCGLKNKAGLRMRFKDNGVDQVRSLLTICKNHEGFPGIAHGGIIASMLDETGARASMVSDHNRFMLTGKMEIKYRQPVPTDVELIVIGTMVKDRGRLAQVHSEIRLPDGTVAAEADLMMVTVSQEYLTDESLEALGWRVYDEGETE